MINKNSSQEISFRESYSRDLLIAEERGNGSMDGESYEMGP